MLSTIFSTIIHFLICAFFLEARVFSHNCCLFDQTIREGSHPCLKSLLKYKKELCNVVVDLHNKDTHCLSEVSIFLQFRVP